MDEAQANAIMELIRRHEEEYSRILQKYEQQVEIYGGVLQ